MKKNKALSVVTSLTNHFLIATPSMDDPFFKKSVIYLCEHNKEGAIGLIINHPIRCPLGFVFDQMDIEIKVPVLSEVNLLIGGPLHQNHGFVIHQNDNSTWRSSLKMKNDLCITTSQDILKAIAVGKGPKEMIFVLGYSAWDAGQIEKELTEDSWLVYAAEDNSLLFDIPTDKCWETAMQHLGISHHQFLMSGGNA